jgi:hypothetical protein
MSKSDTILLRCTGRLTQTHWAEVQKLAADLGAGARAYSNADEAYVYFDLTAPRDVAEAEVSALAAKAAALAGGMKISGVALAKAADIAGRSLGFPAPVHYVVEMEFAPGSEKDITNWYVTEHLPGLASVTGCVRARRYMSAAGRSFACYDLASNLVPETAEWMKWRETPLTQSIRSNFTNMKRGVFLVL